MCKHQSIYYNNDTSCNSTKGKACANIRAYTTTTIHPEITSKKRRAASFTPAIAPKERRVASFTSAIAPKERRVASFTGHNSNYREDIRHDERTNKDNVLHPCDQCDSVHGYKDVKKKSYKCKQMMIVENNIIYA